MPSESILSEIAPSFRPYVQHLLRDLKLGLCKAKFDVEFVSGASDEDCNHFRLVLPYCSKKLKWEILFDNSAPWFAPDFRFDDESFLGRFDVNIIEEQLPSLANWNGKDPKALSQVISELINVYKKHQLNKLKEDENSRAFFEYSALLGDVGTNETDIEVWVQDHLVEFLIKLNIDTAQLPEIYKEGIDENPSLDSALLLVRYPNATNPELILSPSLSRIIGQISLPPMHHSGVLIDYVPTITSLINDKIQLILNNEKFKRYLMAQMITKYNGAVLEHDENKAAFLFEVNDFHWILQIEMDDFPNKSPTLILRSVYYLSKGKPKSKVLPPCPYYNIPKFEAYIMQQFEIFKNECIANNFEN